MSAVACRELFKVHRTAAGSAAALQGLTLTAEPGEMVAVLGPSGSGKTTLLRILAGLERPSAGTASVLGHDVARASRRALAALRRDAIGLVDQHAGRVLTPALGIRAAVATALRLRGEPRATASARSQALLERAGLARLADALPGELSGGERQRAALCVAVAHAPRLVLADEPTGELDAVAADDVLAVLSGLAADGATVVVVTHDPHVASAADRVVGVRDGRVSEEEVGSQAAVVVGRGGWLRVPEELLEAAGISDRARVRLSGEGVVLQPVDRSRPAEDQPRPRVPLRAATGVAADAVAIKRAYGSRTVLDGLTASFAPGTLTAVTGRSGSGKSTLLRLLAGLDRPDAGDVLIGGESLAGRDRAALAAVRSRHVGVVDQQPRLAPFLSAVEQVALALALSGEDGARAEARALEWVGALGLGERAHHRVATLSAGERQRVAIARALAPRRGLLLVDEPTAHLDEANAAAVAELLASIAHDHGATVVCASHDPIVRERADGELALDPARAVPNFDRRESGAFWVRSRGERPGERR